MPCTCLFREPNHQRKRPVRPGAIVGSGGRRLLKGTGAVVYSRREERGAEEEGGDRPFINPAAGPAGADRQEKARGHVEVGRMPGGIKADGPGRSSRRRPASPGGSPFLRRRLPPQWPGRDQRRYVSFPSGLHRVPRRSDSARGGRNPPVRLPLFRQEQGSA